MLCTIRAAAGGNPKGTAGIVGGGFGGDRLAFDGMSCRQYKEIAMYKLFVNCMDLLSGSLFTVEIGTYNLLADAYQDIEDCGYEGYLLSRADTGKVIKQSDGFQFLNPDW